jgi:hypothetical protein
MSRSFGEFLLPALVDGGFCRDDAWIWCGSVIKGEDDQYHMFASMWEKTVPFNPNWLTNSVVVHAVSSSLEVPYTYESDVLPSPGKDYWDGRSHNLTIHRFGYKYLLFYTGITYQADRPIMEPAFSELRLETRGNQHIGMAVALSLNSSWIHPDRSCLDIRTHHWDSFMTTNQVPCVLSDGEIHLLYKSASSNTSPIQYGVARATLPEGPYTKIGPVAPITFGDESIPYEDAFI